MLSTLKSAHGSNRTAKPKLEFMKFSLSALPIYPDSSSEIIVESLNMENK